MNESTLNRMIREHKEHLIWLSVFLVLAVFVTALVFGTLRRSVQAQTYTKRVFVCASAQEGAEPVAHQHNDDCYENGELICTLPERELHIHGDECYAEEKVLVCTLEEGEGHVHTDACYTEEPVLVCGLEENNGHVHSVEAGCYTRVQGDLICTDEDPEHVHTDECYAWEEVLTCEIPEGEGAHHHSEECYETRRILSCGKEEGEGAHTHDDTCYEIQKVLICDKEEVKTEHVHTVDCFQVVDMSPEEIHALHMSELPESDPDADVESPDVWESRFASVPLSGNWDKDLLKIAETQLGYTESQRNFDAVLDENGDGYTLKGWTRYGAWYGIPYGDWCAMFISFCLNYADIPESAIPYDCATTTWIDSLSARGMYAPAGSYDPKPGDLIFFDWEGDGLSDHVGIVWAVNPGSITTIEGNHTISVELFDYDLSDGHIQGYGILPENPALAVTNSVENSEGNEPGENENQDVAEGEAASAAGTSDSADTSGTNSNSVDGEDTVRTELDAETLAKMPPFSYTERVAGIRVSIEADAGAFPEGTTVEIKAIEDDGLAEQVAPVVNGKVVQVQAVDITFYDAEGNEIEPRIPIRVTMRPNTETDEANSVEVVHVDNEGNVNAVTPDAEIAQPDKGAAFDADSFSPYVLVYVLKFDYPVNGKTYESELAGGEDLLLSDLLVQLGVCEEGEVSEFVSKIDSVTASDPEALSVSEKDGVWTVRPMKESEGELSLAIEMQDGAKFSVAVQATGKTEVSSEDNNTVITAVNDLYLPENAVTETAVLTEEESTDAIAAVEKAVEQDAPETVAAPAAEAEGETLNASQVAYQVFSISLDGVEYSKYEDGFQVSLTLPEGIAGKDFEVYHIDNDGNAQKLEIETDAHNLTEETQLVSAVSFVTPSFSDFVIRYTVDFHYKVNGNYYEFSFTGGSFVSLEKLLELLQIPYAPEPELEPVYAAEPAMAEGESGGENSAMGDEFADTTNLTSDTNADEESPVMSESAGDAAETEANETRVVYNDLSGIEVSETTKNFVARIDSVSFTTPELIWVGKVEADTTVGAIKEANSLTPKYSAELTEEQIAEIDAQNVTAGDWALISLKPFQSEEKLVITMDNGYVYKICVTDVWTEPYYVRILLDGNANSTFGKDERYYVLVTANYSGGEKAYNFAQLEIKSEDLSKPYVEYAFTCWKKTNGQEVSNFGDQDSIELNLVKAENSTLAFNELNKKTAWTEGSTIKNYKINYYPEPTSPLEEGAFPYSHMGYIKLTTVSAENEYNFMSILGPAVNYGIVANQFAQRAHIQTTFATNHYMNLPGNTQGIDPNLTNNYGGAIIVGQFSSYVDGVYGNHAGGADSGSGAYIQLGETDYNKLALFVDTGSGLKENGKQKVINLGNTALIERNGKELSDDFINPAITYIQAISTELKNKSATITIPNLGNSLQYTLDTTSFAENATIYVDADNLKDIIKIQGTYNNQGLTINKFENQTIVFNFKSNIYNNQYKDQTNNTTIPALMIEKPYVNQSTSTGMSEDESIARHIVWNLYGVTNKVQINESIGIFLQRNDFSEIDVTSTSTGWIASAGFVENRGGEWHHVYTNMPDYDLVVIRAQKTVNNTTPSSSQTFSFLLDEYDTTVSGNWKNLAGKTTNNSLRSVTFNEIHYSSSQRGWHFYKIREDQNSSGSYQMDSREYYAAVYVNVQNGHVVAYPPVYYTAFDRSLFVDPTASSPLVSYPNQNKMDSSLPSFNNTPLDNPGAVKVTKLFKIDDATKIPNSTFQIEAKWGTNTRILKIEGMESYSDVVLSSETTIDGMVYTWTINNLPINTEVEFTEEGYSVDGYLVKVNGTALASKVKAKAVTNNIIPWPDDGTAAFVNEYTKPSSVDLTVYKINKETQSPIAGAKFMMIELNKDTNGKQLEGGHEYGPKTSSDSEGKLVFDNIPDGYYEIYESLIPSGYIDTGNSTFYIKVDKGEVTWLEKNNSEIVSRWGRMKDNTQTVELISSMEFKVYNFPGHQLPNSGGSGTALYGLLGGLMVVTAGAALTLRKKKNKA